MPATTETNARQLTASQQRQARVVELYLTGKSLRTIAADVGVTVRTVLRDVSRAREEWKERAARTYAELLPDKLAELEQMRQAAWDGWMKSLRDSDSETDSTTVSSGKSNTNRSRTVAKTKARQNGDPRFLALLEKFMRLECQLLGMLDADPVANQPAPVFVEVVVESREDVEQFEALTIDGFRNAVNKN